MKKRICFLTDSIFSFGGVQRVTAVIAKQLALSNDVTIVTMDKPENKDTSIYGLHEADLHYRFFSYPKVEWLKWYMAKFYSMLYRKVLPKTRLASDLYVHSSFPSERRLALAHELQQGHYDIIIGVHAPLSVRLADCKDLLSGAMLIGWIHNSYEALFNKGSRYAGPEMRKHFEYQLEKLDLTIVLSHYDAMRYSFPTRVVYNPLTLVPGNVAEGTSKRFLAIGRFTHRHKGFDLLIKAFNIFAQQDKEWTLDLIGEGVEEPLYQQLIADYGLEQRITIHPFTKDIQQYYSNAQIYVLSSRWEGFGLVIVEAMSHGLPIVSTDLPTSREIMGDFGLYFKNEDVEDLARQLLAATRLDWAQKSQEALQIARHFDISNIITQWKNIIDGQ